MTYYKFGTDGIRGKWPQYINNLLCFKLAHSLKSLNNPRLVIGYDTRCSSKQYAFVIASCASEVNISTTILGICPTSSVIYYSKLYSSIGIMISASHNPYYDNGIKVILNGKKLDYDVSKYLEDSINNFTYNPLNQSAKIIETYNINGYIEYLNTIKGNLKSPYKVLVDNCNGSNSNISRHIYNDMFSDVKYLNSDYNGYNINLNCGSTHPKYALTKLKDYLYDYAILFDGDGDRFLLCDEKRLYSGDEIIYVISKYLKDINKLNDNTVVLTTQSNIGIIESLKEIGINVLISDVGDINVSNSLDDNMLSLGGESSGHIIIPEYLNSGCGIISSLVLFKALNYFNTTMDIICKDIKTYPETNINIKVENEDDKKICDNVLVLSEIEKDLKKYPNSKIILRKSGTESCIRLQVSNKDIKIVDTLTNKYVNIIRSHLNA